MEHFAHESAAVGMVLHRVDDARQFGVIQMDPHGRITQLIEKPAVMAGPQLVNTGIYILRPDRLTWPAQRPLDFAYDVFPALIARSDMAGFEVEGYWSDLGTLTQYRESHFDVMRGRVMLPFDSDDIANIVVDSQARIIEPVWLGDGVTIDAQATVGPNVVLGAGSYVGPWTHVENTVVGQHAFLGAGTRAHDAIVGDGVALGGRCRIGPQSAIGSGTRIGWGTDVSPGARIPADTRLAPNMRLRSASRRSSAVTS
jgi:mannose-1-phosphate guanylyltransferase/phosphomannomutase